jgi:hypothetical protein
MSGAPFWEVTSDPTLLNDGTGDQNDDEDTIPHYS